MVLARKNVVRGSQLPKVSTESCRRAARFLSIMGGVLEFFSKGTNGLILLEDTKQGTVEKQGGIRKTNTPALKYKGKLDMSEREGNNCRKGCY